MITNVTTAWGSFGLWWRWSNQWRRSYRWHRSPKSLWLYGIQCFGPQSAAGRPWLRRRRGDQRRRGCRTAPTCWTRRPNVASQTVPPSAAWEALDCDGDGATNGQEVTDGTDPVDPCDFVIGEPGYGPDRCVGGPRSDGDGVTNGDEVADGTGTRWTNATFIYTSQTVPPSAAWGGCRLRRRRRWPTVTRSLTVPTLWTLRLPAHQPDGADHPGVDDLWLRRRRGDQRRRGCRRHRPVGRVRLNGQPDRTPSAVWGGPDCDGDGVTNGQEVTDGTDPVDPVICTGEQDGPDRCVGRPLDSDGDGDQWRRGLPMAPDPLTNATLFIRARPYRRARHGRPPTATATVWPTVTRSLTVPTLWTPATSSSPARWCQTTQAWRTWLRRRLRPTATRLPTAPTRWTSATLTWPARPHRWARHGRPWSRWRWRDQRTGGNRRYGLVDPCDFVLANQDTAPTAAWEALDCDGDGVTNGDEVADGTDPLDECDLFITSQTVPPSAAWGGRRPRRRRCDQRWRDHWRYRPQWTPCDFQLTSQTVPTTRRGRTLTATATGDQRRRGCRRHRPVDECVTLTWPARPYRRARHGGPWLRWRWRDQRTGGNRRYDPVDPVILYWRTRIRPRPLRGGPTVTAMARPTATRLPMAPTRWTNATLFIRARPYRRARHGRPPTATATVWPTVTRSLTVPTLWTPGDFQLTSQTVPTTQAWEDLDATATGWPTATRLPTAPTCWTSATLTWPARPYRRAR